MKFTAFPIGSRCIIKDITPDEFTTKGGLVIPQGKNVNSDEDLAVVKNSPALRIVEVLAVGEGRADPATGKYLAGSRLVVGGKYLMRGGGQSQMHMDAVPGRLGEFVVLEDTLVCKVEIEESAVTPKPKLAIVS